jgi:hypothetical protein
MVTTRPLPSNLIALSTSNRFDFSKIKIAEAIRQGRRHRPAVCSALCTLLGLANLDASGPE